MKSGKPLPTVDPSKVSHPTSLGFAVTPEHSHLGHFAQEKYLRDGHNSVTKNVTGVMSSGKIATKKRGGAAVARSIGALSRRTARRAIKAGGATAAAVAAKRPILAAKLEAKAAGTAGKARRSLVRTARVAKRKSPGAY